MSEGRKKREDPERTGPIRDWSHLFRDSDSWPGGEDAKQAKTGGQEGRGSWNEVVSGGVDLGYRVIDEYLRQGQRVAQELNDQTYGAGALGGLGKDLWQLNERLLRTCLDLASLWFELLGSVASKPNGPLDPHPGPGAAQEGQGNGPGQERAGDSASPASPPISIEVVSRRPARVTLNLSPSSSDVPLGTHGLRALDAEKPPLEDVRFETGSEHQAPNLRIRVPDDHPPDLYTGVVVDRTTGHSRGTLTVQVLD